MQRNLTRTSAQFRDRDGHRSGALQDWEFKYARPKKRCSERTDANWASQRTPLHLWSLEVCAISRIWTGALFQVSSTQFCILKEVVKCGRSRILEFTLSTSSRTTSKRTATTTFSQRERDLRVVADQRTRLFRELEEARKRHLVYRAIGRNHHSDQ